MLLTGCTPHTCELHSVMRYSWLLQMGIMIHAEMDVVKQLAELAFSPEDLEELYDWIDEGWNWMKKGRRVLSLPEKSIIGVRFTRTNP